MSRLDAFVKSIGKSNFLQTDCELCDSTAACAATERQAERNTLVKREFHVFTIVCCVFC